MRVKHGYWLTIKGDEDKIAIVKIRLVRRIYGSKWNNITQLYEIESNISNYYSYTKKLTL